MVFQKSSTIQDTNKLIQTMENMISEYWVKTGKERWTSVLKTTVLHGAMHAEIGREVRSSMYHKEQNRDFTKDHVNVTSGNSTKLTKGDAMDISHVKIISGIP